MTISLVTISLTYCQPPNRQVVGANFSHPESTIRHYWRQLIKKDYKEALRCFVNFSEDQFLEKDILPLPDIDSLTVDTIILKKVINKKRVEIYYRVLYYSKKDKFKKYLITGDRLILTRGGWKIKDVLIPTQYR